MNIYLETLIPDNPALPVRCWRIQGMAGTRPNSSHWHEMMEIVYTRRGSAIQQARDTFYPVVPGDLSVIGPDQLHSYAASSQEENFDLIVLQFSVEFVIGCFSLPDSFAKDWLSGRLFFPGPVKASAQMDFLLEGILSEMQRRQEGYVRAVAGALMELLVLLYRTSPIRLPAADRRDAIDQGLILLSGTFHLISERCQEEGLSVRQAAENANLSISHFCRLFKQATGMGFHEYLLRYRLSRAEQLFSSGMSLSEIAFSCGFGSLSAFARAFKKWRGLPPGRARRARE